MIQDRTIRFGLLGAGRVAQDFATGLGAVDGAELAAVASRTTGSATAFAEQFPGTRVAESYDDLIADTNVDVVYVATPHHLHAPQSIAAMKAGKAVLCEKPFATNEAEAKTIADAARAHQVFCMEAMWMRFFPAVQRAAQLVHDGTIGEPRMLFADFGVPTAGGPESRFFDPLQGGGALLDRGVYAVSLATMMFGEPDSVAASVGLAPTGVDEHVGAVLGFDGGRVAVLGASLSSYTANTAVITGTHGSITLQEPFYCPTVLSLRHYRAAEPGEPSRRDEMVARLKRHRWGRTALQIARPVLARQANRERFSSEGNGYDHEAREVVRCLRAGLLECPTMTLDDSLVVARTLDQIRASAGG